jgi:hypothetical protein
MSFKVGWESIKSCEATSPGQNAVHLSCRGRFELGQSITFRPFLYQLSYLHQSGFLDPWIRLFDLLFSLPGPWLRTNPNYSAANPPPSSPTHSPCSPASTLAHPPPTKNYAQSNSPMWPVAFATNDLWSGLYKCFQFWDRLRYFSTSAKWPPPSATSAMQQSL